MSHIKRFNGSELNMIGLILFYLLFLPLMIAESVAFTIHEGEFVQQTILKDLFVPIVVVWCIIGRYYWFDFFYLQTKEKFSVWLIIGVLALCSSAMTAMMLSSSVLLTNACFFDSEEIQISGEVVEASTNDVGKWPFRRTEYFISVEDNMCSRTLQLEVSEREYAEVGEVFQQKLLMGRWGLFFTLDD